MKNWHIILVFLIGVIIFIVGALFKLMHWPGASATLATGIMLQIISGAMVVIKLLLDRKNGFLNK